jgi:hypothetical protein
MARKVLGRISWVPMVIRRDEVEIADPNTFKMQKHWPVKLVFNMAFDEVIGFRKNAEHLFLTESLGVAEPEADDDLEAQTVGDQPPTTVAPAQSSPVAHEAKPSTQPVTAPVATADAATEGPNSVISGAIRAELVVEIKDAATLTALQAVGAKAKKLAESGKLTKADQEILRTRYEQCKQELQRIQKDELASAGKGKTE